MASNHVILGTGAIGRATAEELVKRAIGAHGKPFREDGRDPGRGGGGCVRSLRPGQGPGNNARGNGGVSICPAAIPRVARKIPCAAEIHY